MDGLLLKGDMAWGVCGEKMDMEMANFWSPYNLNLPNPTFLSGPYKLHIRVHNKNLQKSRVW